LITLAYANALDLLLKPGWTLAMVDMVLLEVTRNQTPTSDTIKRWIDHRRVSIRRTRICEQHLNDLKRSAQPSKSNLSELASQEIMNGTAATAAAVCVSVRRSQDRPRKFSASGPLHESEHARISDLSRRARMDRFGCTHRKTGDQRGAYILLTAFPARITMLPRRDA
jgi:hypothetical protein